MALRDEAWRHRLDAYPVRLRVDTRYGDMDENGHLNNVALARLVEESRVRFHARLAEAGRGAAPGERLMVAHVGIDFVAEGCYPEPVEAGIAVVAIGQRSYRLAIGLFQSAGAIALADSVMVRAGRDGLPALAGDARAALEEMMPRPMA